MSVRVALAIFVGLGGFGCSGSGSLGGTSESYQWVNQRNPAPPNAGAFAIRWTQQLSPQLGGKYVPVEYASAGFDPGRKRVYVGSTYGTFHAFGYHGRTRYTYEAGANIEAPPAVDVRSGEVFVTSTDGMVHALSVDGELRWKHRLSGAIYQAPLLTDDALYVVTLRDLVTALSRSDGQVLWEFQGEQIEEFTISGHAGLTLIDGQLLTGLTNGQVVSLNPTDGTLRWDIDTSIDAEVDRSNAPEFYDVDTTPVVIGDSIYVASFTTGLYALDLSSGTVRWRHPEFREITGIAPAAQSLVISSGRRGVFLFDTTTRKVQWQRRPERGAPTEPLVTSHGTVLFGETDGSLLALALSDGREVGRAESGYGFSARPAVSGKVGAALSNAGRFHLLRLY